MDDQLIEEGSSRKRNFVEDDFYSSQEPPQKKLRFPKGKKVRFADLAVHETTDSVSAAEERRRLRCPLLADDCEFRLPNIAEYDPKKDAFEDDGIQIEPFNLTKEREEGYFDESGNYMEYMNKNQTKDAWVEEIDENEDEIEGGEISKDEIGKMKRRIANILESEETVLQALKRLKGNSKNRKAKMTPDIKRVFDQLTEDAMLLMESGEYNVYDDKQEVFQREADGYEQLAKDNEKDEQNDYVYDESSGYYYSSKLGYYYDPTTQFYCNASSGQWFFYDAELDTYCEV